MAPATKTDDAQADATRAEILRHAHSLFTHYGFNKTNIGDIAKCCEMSPGNLYRYFRNKQAIGLAAVRQYFDEAEAAMAGALASCPNATAEERLRTHLTTGISHILNEMQRNPKMLELAEFLCEDEAGLELLQQHIAWRRARTVAEIDRGMASGEFAPCDAGATAAAMGNALKVFWMPMTLARWHDPSTIMPELHAVLDLIFCGLRA